jgi:excinuclease ABC subunit A
MADYIIDLGPEGGDAGGEVVATGSPDEIIKNRRSYTAEYLRDKLQADKKSKKVKVKAKKAKRNGVSS